MVGGGKEFTLLMGGRIKFCQLLLSLIFWMMAMMLVLLLVT